MHSSSGCRSYSSLGTAAQRLIRNWSVDSRDRKNKHSNDVRKRFSDKLRWSFCPLPVTLCLQTPAAGQRALALLLPGSRPSEKDSHASPLVGRPRPPAPPPPGCVLVSPASSPNIPKRSRPVIIKVPKRIKVPIRIALIYMDQLSALTNYTTIGAAGGDTKNV